MNFESRVMMERLIRIIYVSRASFEIDAESGGIEPEVFDILKAARTYNKEHNIGGVFCLESGYFFQCLEGKESRVYGLLDRIKQDMRHHDLKISYCKPVRWRLFKDWSMKYVSMSNDIKALMQSRGYDRFDPVHFDESDVNAIVDYLVHAKDTTLNNEVLKEAYFLKQAWWKRFLEPKFTHN